MYGNEFNAPRQKPGEPETFNLSEEFAKPPEKATLYTVGKNGECFLTDKGRKVAFAGLAQACPEIADFKSDYMQEGADKLDRILTNGAEMLVMAAMTFNSIEDEDDRDAFRKTLTCTAKATMADNIKNSSKVMVDIIMGTPLPSDEACIAVTKKAGFECPPHHMRVSILSARMEAIRPIVIQGGMASICSDRAMDKMNGLKDDIEGKLKGGD